MEYDISPLEKARELLLQIEQEDRKTSEVQNSEGPTPDPGSEILKTEEKPTPGSTDAYNINSTSSENVLERIFSIQTEDVLRGIVYSEILSKPRALRRRVRW